MLRKLFISLLILSALTAKGGFGQFSVMSGQLPGDVVFSLYGNAGGCPAVLAEGAAGAGSMESPAFYIRYAPAAGEAQKGNWAKFQEQADFTALSYNCSYNGRYMRIILPYTAFNSARAVLYGSDPSPPV